jgi:Tfp pilus assembly protein PilO
MGYKSITQITLFIISLVVIFTYIKPTFIAMRSTQDEIFQYTDAANKAGQLNQQLAELLTTEKSFSRTDLVSLESFLPSTIDAMSVMADISTVASQNGLSIDTVSAGELILPQEDILFEGKRIESNGTVHIDFTANVTGTYESLKQTLHQLEQSRYLLEVVELSFGEFLEDDTAVEKSADDKEGKYTIVLRAYAYSLSDNNSSL